MNTLTQNTNKITQLTADLLVQYALDNDIEFEAFSEFTDRYGDLNICYSYIGLELKPHIYFWWKSFTGDATDRDFLIFDHRYNRNNGSTIRGMKGYYAEQNILKQINK